MINMIRKQLEEFLENKGFERFESGEPYGEIYIKDDNVIFVNVIKGAHEETIRNIKSRHERLLALRKRKMAEKTENMKDNDIIMVNS